MSTVDEARHQAAGGPAGLIADLIQRGALAQVAYVAAELRLADHLAEVPMRIDEIARATGAHARSLHRVLRALVTLGLCEERDDGSFSMSPAGLLLREDAADSLRSWLLWFGRNQWTVWGQLLDTVRTGVGARKGATGRDGLLLFDRDPEAAAIFNMTMVQQTRLVARHILRACDFAAANTIVDVGGGHGAVVEVVLGAHPGLHGVLFDRPHALEGARKLLARAGVGDRCELVSGDFFEEVPRGGDLYILKSIVHDWDDDRATLILRNCRDAMRAGGRLLLIERILPDQVEASAAHRSLAYFDLTMMLGPGGQERTEAQFRRLLQSSGFELTGLKPIALEHCVLEASLAGTFTSPRNRER